MEGWSDFKGILRSQIAAMLVIPMVCIKEIINLG